MDPYGVPAEDMVSLVQKGCMLQADAAVSDGRAASALYSSLVGGGATHCDNIANALQLRFVDNPKLVRATQRASLLHHFERIFRIADIQPMVVAIGFFMQHVHTFGLPEIEV